MIFQELYPHPHKPGVRVCKQTLDRILKRDQIKSENTQVKEPPKTPATVLQMPKDAPAQTITPEQQRAVSDLAKLKAGIPFTRSYVPQAETRAPEPAKPLSFEEQIIADWKNNPGIRAEFVNLSSYQAFRKAEKRGKARIIKDRVTR